MLPILTSFVMQTTDGSDGGSSSLIQLVWYILLVVGLWKIFTKDGKPGWPAIIPIYNYIVLLQIIGKSIWWFIVLLIPFVSIIGWIHVARAFGKGWGYAIGLTLLTPVFLLILGFSDAPIQKLSS